MIWWFIEGVLSGQDTLGGVAFSLRDFEAVRLWAYVAVLIAALLATAGTVIFAFAPLIVGPLFGANNRTSNKVFPSQHFNPVVLLLKTSTYIEIGLFANSYFCAKPLATLWISGHAEVFAMSAQYGTSSLY